MTRTEVWTELDINHIDLLHPNMAHKTNTTAQNIFHRKDSKDPRCHAIFDLSMDPARPGFTRITLPEKSTWSASPHWHEQYTEYFKVLQGRVLLTVNGKSKSVTAEDGPQRVERYAVHDFCRADKDSPDGKKDAGDVVTEEWTDPADGMKHVFFRNLFSTLQDTEKYWGRWTEIQALTTASEYDNFVQIIPGRVSYAATHSLYACIWIVAKLTGVRAWQQEYTPQELRALASGEESSKMK